MQAALYRSLTTRFGSGPRVHFPLPVNVRDHVKTIAAELASGRFRPVIDRTLALGEIVEAHRYVDTATKTGNVVLEVA